MAPAKRSTRRPSKKRATKPKPKPGRARKAKVGKRAAKQPARTAKPAKKKAARTTPRPPAVDPDATSQFSLEVTQQVSVAEVLGDIEEAQALDSLTEHE